MSLGAIGNGKVLGGIVSALDGGVVLNLHVLSVLGEVKHSNHALRAVVILCVHSLGVNEYLSNLVAVVTGLLGGQNAVNVGVTADNHTNIRMLAEELIPQAVCGVVGGIVCGGVAGSAG